MFSIILSSVMQYNKTISRKVALFGIERSISLLQGKVDRPLRLFHARRSIALSPYPQVRSPLTPVSQATGDRTF